MCWKYEDIYGVCTDHVTDDALGHATGVYTLRDFIKDGFGAVLEPNTERDEEFLDLLSKWHEEGRLTPEGGE